jgi:hypothetical protein
MDTDRDRLRRFAQLVRLYRDAQDTVVKKRDHSPRAIRNLRDLEARVDKSVDWIVAQTEPVQKDLFENDARRTAGPYGRGGSDGRR